MLGHFDFVAQKNILVQNANKNQQNRNRVHTEIATMVSSNDNETIATVKDSNLRSSVGSNLSGVSGVGIELEEVSLEEAEGLDLDPIIRASSDMDDCELEAYGDWDSLMRPLF